MDEAVEFARKSQLPDDQELQNNIYEDKTVCICFFSIKIFVFACFELT